MIGALYTFKAGYASLGGVHGQDLAEMNEESVLWIASVTKLMTSVAAMQCVERGLITLDQSLEHVLPELKKALVLEGFDDLGDPITRPLLKTPTLRYPLAPAICNAVPIRKPLTSSVPSKDSFYRTPLGWGMTSRPPCCYSIVVGRRGLFVGDLFVAPLYYETKPDCS